VFPELSLTGYEPDLAAELALTPDDSRLEELRALARKHEMELVVGAPLVSGAAKPFLGAIVLSASGETQSYRKMHLGTSERPWFVPGDKPLALTMGGHTVGIAICADTSQATHPQWYAEGGAGIYAAGVCLNAEWYSADAPRLAEYAARHGMLTLMANHGASVGTYASVGKSAVWSPGGALLMQATGTASALLVATSDDGTWRGEIILI
jgi:predicted amidohydrolase